MTVAPLPSVVFGYVCPWSRWVLDSGMSMREDERDIQSRDIAAGSRVFKKRMGLCV